MGYYCNVCKKTISMEEFQFSMNKHGKALCRDHRRISKMSCTTKDLQGLVRNRHKDELKKEIPNLKTIKDWIKADFETWDKAIKKDDDGSYIIKVSEEDLKNSYSKRIKNKDKS